MSGKDTVFEVVAIFMSLLFFKSDGITVGLHSDNDCGRTYDLNLERDVDIWYKGNTYSDCQVIFTGSDSSDYPRTCVQAKRMDVADCSVEVEVHYFTVVDGYAHQTYTCSSPFEKACTYSDKLIVVFKRVGSASSGDAVDVLINVYAEKRKEYESGISSWIIPVSITASVLMMILVFGCVLFSVFRRRAMLARATEYRPPQSQPMFSPYPTAAQYQTGNPSVAGYQPPAAGYPPTQPVPGYLSQPQGYPVQPQTGFQSVDQGAYRGHSADDQNTPSAPAADNSSGAPPSYEKALEMKERRGT